MGRSCPHHGECFFYQARRRIKTANILVVNHALLVTDLALKVEGFGILPDYQVAVIDEAHTLESVAGERLGVQLSNVGIDYSLARLYNARTNKGVLAGHQGDFDEAKRQAMKVRDAAEDFFNHASKWFHDQPNGYNGRIRKPTGWSEYFCEELRRLAAAIDRGARGLEKPEDRIELTAAEERCRTMADQVAGWIRQTSEEAVYWIEVEHKSRLRVRLAAAPLDVGPALRKLLFTEVDTCVLTSATLCVGSPPRFDFLQSRIGLTAAETLALGSPFDYAKQVTIHVPNNLPDPSDQPNEFEQQAIRAVAHYLERTHGKAFVLFTSYKMLEVATRTLTPWLARRNIAVFSQSDGMPRSKMVDAFKADIDSVIFGVDSFWQGVDVPGETLSNVIITRLPFSVPSHPLLEARLEDIRRRGGNPFVDYQVPEAVIKLKQGFGRLIRTRTDRGIVVILDPRVLSKPYGRTFLKSLPECPRIVEALSLGQMRLDRG
jgi:ATP-dependent DNA helicase DinG